MNNLSYENKFDFYENEWTCRGNTFSYEWFHTKTRFDTEAYIKPPSPHYLSFAKMYFLLIISIHSNRCRLRESRHQSLCDACLCVSVVWLGIFCGYSSPLLLAAQELWFQYLGKHYIEHLYFSFKNNGDDDVDTPCWIKLDVLPALEQGQGNVTQGKGLLVMSCKKKVTCNVTQAVESVSLSHFWWAGKFLWDFVRSTEILIERFSW